MTVGVRGSILGTPCARSSSKRRIAGTSTRSAAAAIARTLGLKADTLMRWCRDSREPKFARVVVKRAAQPRLTAHGPAGARIEQLSIQHVAELFGALPCSD